jgi:hypothetical protein
MGEGCLADFFDCFVTLEHWKGVDVEEEYQGSGPNAKVFQEAERNPMQTLMREITIMWT